MLLILQAIFALILQWIWTLINTLIGWATILIFGKVPDNRQIYLSIIGFASIFWVFAVLGIIFPGFTTFLFVFILLPKWMDKTWVRLGMFFGALLLPLMVGFLTLLLYDPDIRPKGIKAKIDSVFIGYRFTLGLGISMIITGIVAPIMKMRTIFKRWVSLHIPVIIKKDDYLQIVKDIHQMLEFQGLENKPQPMEWIIRFPTKVFVSISGGDQHNLILGNLTVLHGRNFEVLFHPTDLVISGEKDQVSLIRAIICKQLAFSKVYMTWNKKANAIEDRLSHLWSILLKNDGNIKEDEILNELNEIELEVNHLKIPYSEWEILFREKLLVERSLLQTKAGITAHPQRLIEPSA